MEPGLTAFNIVRYVPSSSLYHKDMHSLYLFPRSSSFFGSTFATIILTLFRRTVNQLLDRSLAGLIALKVIFVYHTGICFQLQDFLKVLSSTVTHLCLLITENCGRRHFWSSLHSIPGVNTCRRCLFNLVFFCVCVLLISLNHLWINH